MAKNSRMVVMVRPHNNLHSSNNSRRRNSIYPIRSTLLNFDWSLKPMTIWFKVFGIQPLSIHKDENCHQSLLLITVAIVFYLMTIGCNAIVMSHIKWTVETKNYTSATKDWNSIINQVNYCVLTVTTHSALLYASYFMSWKGLADLLRLLEQCGQFENSHYQKFRRIFRIGSYLVLTEIAIEFAETLIDRLWISKATLPTLQILFSGLNIVALMFPYIGSIMFCTLGWMASAMFQTMAEEMDSATNRTRHDLNDGVTSHVIDECRRRYFLIVEFVDQMSRHFGFLLLVVTTSEFVRMTNTSFHLLTEFLSHHWTLSTIIVAADYLKETIGFCVLVYIPSRIYREANNLIRKLRLIDANDSDMQHQFYKQLRFLAEEMIHSLPSVTPMGMIHINLQLVPTLIGTTLTYLIILCQFQSSETIDNKT